MAKREQPKPEARASTSKEVSDPTRKIGPGFEPVFTDEAIAVEPKRAEALQTPPISDEVAANRIAILKSPSYQLAELDIDFLGRKENRPLRMQLELLKTETLLRENHVDATVVVFGGTQIMPREQAEAVLREARHNAQKLPGDP